ncbi:MAG: alpha/beta fold hydrolase [Patescibacteria group bacterium]|nr:alpha/beta fold hydrolase [Patescibacteria group bacterium]MDD5121593.1 alpha/beta fold hydrolase [Patescibacteria group bacterium]MDD5222226.1 alpha/beta fold hydrolase [Patescibacteria group bacterium]MDD5396243.1 alpha/beta fold hydrolase [Patescibacteria group bacterium]
MKLYFKNKSGLRLCGVLDEPKKKGDTCVILCHGLGVDKNEYNNIFVKLKKRLVQKGMPVFRFDFMAHGESQGKSINMTIIKEKYDLEVAVSFLRKLGYKNFGILGASFGGGAVALFSAQNKKIIKAAVLWNALIDYHSILKPTLSWPKRNFGSEAMKRLKKSGYIFIGGSKFKMGKKLFSEMKKLHPGQIMAKTKIPTLFIHGTNDNYIPYQDSVKYSKLFKNAKVKLLKDAQHGFDDSKEHTEEAIKYTTDFFAKFI